MCKDAHCIFQLKLSGNKLHVATLNTLCLEKWCQITLPGCRNRLPWNAMHQHNSNQMTGVLIETEPWDVIDCSWLLYFDTQSCWKHTQALAPCRCQTKEASQENHIKNCVKWIQRQQFLMFFKLNNMKCNSLNQVRNIYWYTIYLITDSVTS